MARTCPLSTRRLVDEYFIENRARVIDLAAFLDRLERSNDNESPEEDFRIRALRKALVVLLEPGPDRVTRTHMLFSDPTTEPREKLDRKAAYGAYNPALEAR